MLTDQTKITVCESCLTASCWHAELVCDSYKSSGTVEKTIQELIELDREHPSHWEKQLLEAVPKEYSDLNERS